MNHIKSFEESTQKVYGDILSEKRTKSKIKIGLLLFGYFEYWRMFSDSLREAVDSNLKAIDNRLRNEFDIICTDMVDTLDSADISGRILKESEIDALIVVMGTYLPDYITMHAINYVKDVPIIVFSVQEDSYIDSNSDYLKSIRNSSIIGSAQLTATFRKIGRKYKAVVGSLNDPEAYAKIRNYIKALQALNDIKEANIGIIGNVFRGMYDLELSKTFLKGKFDVNAVYIQNSHLFNAWEQTDDAEVQKLAESLMKRFPMRTVTKTDVVRSCKLAIAMRKIVIKYRLDGLCFLDQHYIQKLFRTTARMGASLLIEELSIPVCCEGDIAGIVMAMLMQSLTNKHPLQGEWAEYDEKLNTYLVRGHGIADPSMAKSENEITLTRTPEEWGMDGVGLNYEFIVKPGICTIGSLLEVPNNYSMFLSKVESIEYPTLNYNEIHAMLKVGLPVKEYFEKLLEFGVPHHCILVDDDVVKELEIISEILNLEKLVL